MEQHHGEGGGGGKELSLMQCIANAQIPRERKRGFCLAECSRDGSGFRDGPFSLTPAYEGTSGASSTLGFGTKSAGILILSPSFRDAAGHGRLPQT